MRSNLLRLLREAISSDRQRPTWLDLPELALLAVAFLCYFLVRADVVGHAGLALQHARWIIDMQRSLGVFVEPAVNAWALRAPWRVDLFDFVYFWLDFPLIATIGIVLFWRNRRGYLLLRDALLISGGLALLFYWVFPVAPPRFLPEWGFVDTLQQFAHASYQAQSLKPFVNPFASVPSLHVGWSLLLAIVLYRSTTNPLIRLAGMSVLILQTVAVIATANHYLTDATLGVVVSLLALVAAVWLQRAAYPRMREWVRVQLRRGETPRAAHV